MLLRTRDPLPQKEAQHELPSLRREDGLRWGAAAFLFLATFQSFGTLFLSPVLAGYELVTQRNWGKLALALGLVALVYVGLYVGWGYNYLVSFRVAAARGVPGL